MNERSRRVLITTMVLAAAMLASPSSAAQHKHAKRKRPIVKHKATAPAKAPSAKSKAAAKPPTKDEMISRLWKLADHEFHIGHYEQAIAYDKRIIKLDPTETEAYSCAAWLLESLGREKEAMDMLLAAAAANPKVCGPHFDLGFWYHKRKDYTTARRHFEEAAKWATDTMALRMLAHTCEKMGDLAGSVEAWKKLLTSSPDDEVARKNMKRVEGKLTDQGTSTAPEATGTAPPKQE